MRDFFEAIDNWDYDTVLKLLQAGVDPNTLDDDGMPGLFNLIWVCCDDPADTENMYDEAYRIAEILIQYGADPNMYIESEHELLVDCILDCTYDHSEERDRFLYNLVDLLIVHGADCKSFDADKRRDEINQSKLGINEERMTELAKRYMEE